MQLETLGPGITVGLVRLGSLDRDFGGYISVKVRVRARRLNTIQSFQETWLQISAGYFRESRGEENSVGERNRAAEPSYYSRLSVR